MATLERTAIAVAINDIAFATDFSPASEAALPYVEALSSRYGALTHVAHVLPDITFLRPGSPDAAMMGSIYEDAHNAAQTKIQRLSKRLQSIPHRTYLRHGKIAEAMEELVKEHHVQLLIAGTHGRTGLGKLVMGSIAEEMLRQVRCPTLTVGPKVAGDIHRRGRINDKFPLQVNIRQILYATDFQQESDEAMSYATSLATQFGARLALLHVIEDYGEHLQEKPGPIESTLRKLSELVPVDSECEYEVELLAQFGVAADSILKTAAARETDLIILGARPSIGNSAATTHLTRSVAYKVIVGASCPVLTVRG